MELNFELNDELLITDMTELEEGVEYYIKFDDNDRYNNDLYNGFYKITKLCNEIKLFNEMFLAVKIDNPNTNFNLTYTKCLGFVC